MIYFFLQNNYCLKFTFAFSQSSIGCEFVVMMNTPLNNNMSNAIEQDLTSFLVENKGLVIDNITVALTTNPVISFDNQTRKWMHFNPVDKLASKLFHGHLYFTMIYHNSCFCCRISWACLFFANTSDLVLECQSHLRNCIVVSLPTFSPIQIIWLIIHYILFLC